MAESPLADSFMPPDLSPEIRRFVEIVAAVKALEHNLPLIEEIEEVENLRSQTIALVKWAEERAGRGLLQDYERLTEELKRYGVRVGQMCQRQKMQLLRKAHSSKANGSSPSLAPLQLKGEQVPPPPPPLPEGFSPLPPLKESAVSEEQKEAFKKAIRAKARARGEKIDEKTVALRLRWRLARMHKVSKRNKARKRPEGPRPQTAPSDKFKRYWVQEKKLLYKYFETPDLAWLAERWWKEFFAYRAEEERLLSEVRQERERRKAVAALTKA